MDRYPDSIPNGNFPEETFTTDSGSMDTYPKECKPTGQ